MAGPFLPQDPYLQQMIDSGLVDDRAQILAQQMKRGQGLMQTPGAQGQAVGGTFQAASPLEHFSSALARIMGGRQVQQAEQGMGDLLNQKREARVAYANTLGPPPQAEPQVPPMLARPDPQQPPPQWSPAGESLPPVPKLVAPQRQTVDPSAIAALSGDPAIMAAGAAQTAGQHRQHQADVEVQKHEFDQQKYSSDVTARDRAQSETERRNRADEEIRRKALLAKPAGGGHGGMGMAAPDDVEAVADGIVSGQQPPTLSELRSNTTAVRAALQRRGYNLSAAQTDWAATTKHVATLNGPQQLRLRQAVYTVDHSLDTLDSLYGQWQKLGPASGFKVFNRAALAAAKNTPGETGAVAQALEAQINDLTAELGQVYMGGNSPTDHALKLAGENLKSDWNEATFRKMIDLARTNLRIRQNSIANSAPIGTGPNQYAEPAPAAPAAPGRAGAGNNDPLRIR